MQKALISAMSSAARNAPGIEPSPPTTTTTKASDTTARSSSRFAGSRGIASAPPSPASAAPSMNTPVNSQRWLTPSAPVISRSSVARSEERRVGKEGRYGRAMYHEKKRQANRDCQARKMLHELLLQ